MEFKKIVAWLIIFFMSFSILGYIGANIFGGEGEERYGDFVFYQDNLRWRVEVEGERYFFDYLPGELENISLDLGQELLGAGKVYLVYEPGGGLDSSFAINKLGSFFYKKGLVVVKACAFEEGCPDIPVMDCSEKVGVVFEEAEKVGFEQKENCLVLKAGDSLQLNRLGERLIYGLLGIM